MTEALHAWCVNSMASAFPFEFYDVEASINQQLIADFHGERTGFIQVGPKKYIMTAKYREFAAAFYNFKIRPDDAFILTYPRSGTTVMQEMLWFNVVVHDGLLQDVLQLVQGNEEMTKQAYLFASSNVPMLQASSSPRVIKSHLPLSLLPPATLDTCKLLVLVMLCYAAEETEDGDGDRHPTVRQDFMRDTEMNIHRPDPEQVRTFLGLNVEQLALPYELPKWCIRTFFYMFLFVITICLIIFVVYMARNPKDMAVSFYHHNRLFKTQHYVGDFPKYWNYFQRDLLLWCPYWEHLAEAWEQRHHPNMLFLFYEDLVKQHLHIDNFRHNSSTNLDGEYLPGLRVEGEQNFIRKDFQFPEP
ncbi:hypothetical protein B566_EDAN005174 [Ephemera danica]|nr:hypothetical protein B566_EDAN005174 [Ephemera danica]